MKTSVYRTYLGMIGKVSFLIGFCELSLLNALVSKNIARFLSNCSPYHRRYVHSTLDSYSSTQSEHTKHHATSDPGIINYN